MKRIALFAVPSCSCWRGMRRCSRFGSQPHEPHLSLLRHPRNDVALGFPGNNQSVPWRSDSRIWRREPAGGVLRGTSFDRVPIIFLHGNKTRLFRPPAIRSAIPTILPNIFNNGTSPASCGVWDTRETMRPHKQSELQSGVAHSTAAAVPLLRAFVRAVMAYTEPAGRYRGAQPRRDSCARMDVPGQTPTMWCGPWWRLKGLTTASSDCSPDPANFFSSQPMAALFRRVRSATSTERRIRNFSPRSTRPVNLPARPAILCCATFSGHRRRAGISSTCRHRMDSSLRCPRGQHRSRARFLGQRTSVRRSSHGFRWTGAFRHNPGTSHLGILNHLTRGVRRSSS